MLIFLRILMLLIPVALLFLWLRWRMKRNQEGGLSDADEQRAKVTLIVLIVALLASGISLKLLDNSGSPSGRYVPARVEDGRIIEGHFVEDEEEAEPKEKPEADQDQRDEEDPS